MRICNKCICRLPFSVGIASNIKLSKCIICDKEENNFDADLVFDTKKYAHEKLIRNEIYKDFKYLGGN